MSFRNISTNQIVVWAALLLGLVASLALGSTVGASDVKTVSVAFALLLVAMLLIWLKVNIWILIPIGWYLNGRLGFLPLPLTVRDLLLSLSIGAFVLFFALRAIPRARKRTAVDYLMYINLAYLVSVYVRNPAGLYAFGSDVVGGKPYFEVVLAFCVYLVLSRVTPSATVAKNFPLFSLIPLTTVSLLDAVSRTLPALAPTISYVYSGVVSSLSALGSIVEGNVARIPSFQFVAQVGGLAACSYYRPISLINPMFLPRIVGFALIILAIFVSGHRIALLDFVAFFVLGTLLRNTFRDLWIIGAVATFSVLAAIGLQGTMLQLPIAAQRVLTMIPADWDSEAVVDADSTTTWRLDMWKWAWEDNRILRDKVWGQGFGVNADDLNILSSKLQSGTGSEGAFVGASRQEWFLLYGGFHNGPISTVRCVGGVGFVLFVPLMFYLAFTAWKLARRAVNTRACGLVLFTAIPLIYEPFKFLSVFGGFETALANTIFGAGLLNMASNYLSSVETPPDSIVGQSAQDPRDPVILGA